MPIRENYILNNTTTKELDVTVEDKLFCGDHVNAVIKSSYRLHITHIKYFGLCNTNNN